MKLDLGCGVSPQEGFKGVDFHTDADYQVNLFEFPWPFKKSSVTEVFCSHFVEHIPHGDGPHDLWYLFWNEVHRICKKNAKVTVIHPYGKNNRAFQDPTHRRFLVEESWQYLTREWLDVNKIGHYTGFTGDFEIVTIAGTGMDTNIAMRNAEYQTQARQWYWNVIPDLVVELKVKK